MAVLGLPRRARLKRRRLIRPLFDRTRSDVGTIATGTIRLLYREVSRTETGGQEPVQTGFAVGRVRSAVRRNALRRTLREVFRIHQHVLPAAIVPATRTVTLMILFRGGSRRHIVADLPQALQQLACRLREKARRYSHDKE